MFFRPTPTATTISINAYFVHGMPHLSKGKNVSRVTQKRTRPTRPVCSIATHEEVLWLRCGMVIRNALPTRGMPRRQQGLGRRGHQQFDLSYKTRVGSTQPTEIGDLCRSTTLLYAAHQHLLRAWWKSSQDLLSEQNSRNPPRGADLRVVRGFTASLLLS